MTIGEIRQKYLWFFQERGHVFIPSASLVPENDSTTLFIGSGMQPLIPYLLGQTHPAGKRITNAQKSFRAEDIDEVGDNRHTTFFEMLGNWSFGDYWKEEQLSWFFDFLTDSEKGIGLDPARLYVTVFAGDPEMKIPGDEASVQIWQRLFENKGIDARYVELGSEKEGGEKGMQNGRIFSYDIKKNWWSRSGIPSKMPVGEPGGPDSEVFYEFDSIQHDTKFGMHCHPNCDCGRFLEIGNSVFMEYKKRSDGMFEKLAQRNVDFGGGLERIAAAANDDFDIFNIDIFKKVKDEIALLCHVRYEEGENEFVVAGTSESNHGMYTRDMQRAYRVILDHVRSATFLIGDGVLPHRVDKGYLVRRLLRRAVRFSDQLKIPQGYLSRWATLFIDVYQDVYPVLSENRAIITEIINREEEDFRKVLLREGPRLAQYIEEAVFQNAKLDPEIVFQFVTTHGIPIELIIEDAKARGVQVSIEDHEKLMKKHHDISRGGIEQKFKGGLADTSEKTIRLHTAHHLLLKALQMVLGPEVKQRGSNITSERLRLDFNYDGKMTEEQKKEVERIVNKKIAEDLPVIRNEMAREDAEKLGAEHEFGQKYPERVSVYSIGPKSATIDNPQLHHAFSIEFCGGPHVTHTGEIGQFKILKEESVAAGIRRIRGVIS